MARRKVTIEQDREAALAASSASEVGELESLDGTWLVTWDHTDAGYLTYLVEDREDGGNYVARWDDGWRIAPEGRTTVDNERLLDESAPDLMELVEVLNRASGRQPVPGVHTWKEAE
jgi:hypothetical protein